MLFFDKTIIPLIRKIGIKNGFWVVDLISVGIVAYVAATSVNRYLFNLIDINPIPATETAEAALPPQPHPELKDFLPILNRNLFNPEGPKESEEDLDGKAPLSAGNIAVSAPPVSSKYKLIGTVVGVEPEYSTIMVQILGSGEQASYRLGEEIENGIRVVEVQRFTAILDNHGKEESLDLDMEEGMASGSGSAGRGTPSLGQTRAPVSLNPNEQIVRTGESSWMLDKQYVESELNDINRLITEVRAVPNMTPDGSSDGFKLFAIRNGSLFSKIGLRNGDVVRSVNGLQLNSIEQGLETFQALRHESNLNIEISRNGQAKTLNYTIQ